MFARHDLPPRIADDKTLDAHVQGAKQRKTPPAANHPWKKPFSPKAYGRSGRPIGRHERNPLATSL